ncbi:hypothetical protein B9Z55_007816 [Caenorhabditis nigoni]|uniref:BTB domain-containing protein n=1 Tax=Caenorhabditis nigoni TaxID=1611254 RepID=A0A2G5VBC8_9PELO|nr:hypothetical protein B9Z55_007816 [Caenorhabditis nigoni]
MSEKEFTMRYEFKNVGQLRDGQEIFSPEEDHVGLKWWISIQKWGAFLRMFFSTRFGDGEIHVDYIKRIFSKNKQNIYSISGSKQLKINYGPCTFIDWGNLESEFLNDGKLDAEIYLKITKMIGFPLYQIRTVGVPMERKNYGHQMPLVRAPMGHFTPRIAFPRKELRSFGEDMRQFSDVILKVKDRKFYVSKLTLSSQSPYFATLFFGRFQESGKSEIELKNTTRLQESFH